MIFSFVQLLIFLLNIHYIEAQTTYTWVAATGSFATPSNNYRMNIMGHTWSTLWINYTANANVESNSDNGNFKINVQINLGGAIGNVNGETRCIAMGEDRNAVLKAMNEMIIIPSFNGTLGNYTEAMVITGGLGWKDNNYVKQYRISVKEENLVTVSYTETGCESIMLIGEWNNANSWTGGSTWPGDTDTTDNVVINANDAKVMLPPNTESTFINKLTIDGGSELIGHRTGCPAGWSVAPWDIPNNQEIGRKCYKLFTTHASFADAELTCQTQGIGSKGATLVHIGSFEELNAVKDLCRGDGVGGGEVAATGCWIGMRDYYGVGSYDWEVPSTFGNPFHVPTNGYSGSNVGSAFVDWRASEPNNRTFSEGLDSSEGERCVYLAPYEGNPWHHEEGSFGDSACKVKKSFVCQILQNTFRHTLSANVIDVQNGGLTGGILKITNGESIIYTMVMDSSAVLYVDTNAHIDNLDTLELKDGSSLELYSTHTPAMKQTNGFIGEQADNRIGIRPRLYVANSHIQLLDGPSVNWRARVRFSTGSKIEIDNKELTMGAGGDLSLATLELRNGATLSFSAGAARLATWDSFDVYIAHRGEVIGEYTGRGDDPEDQSVKGVYRIKVADANNPSIFQLSACIPYNATSTEMEDILNDNSMTLIHDNGDVTVRRYGNGASKWSRYGYRYRIDMDSPPTDQYGTSLDFSIDCVGLETGCNCSFPKVSSVDHTGQRNCPGKGASFSSKYDINSCAVYPTDLRVERFTTLRQINIPQADGVIQVTNGVHRFPPDLSTTSIKISGGSIMATGNTLTWKELDSTNNGRIVVFGYSWLAWRSAVLLYQSSYSFGRYKANLNTAPAFDMSLTTLKITDDSNFLFATPNSNVKINNGTWAGGVIAGRCTLSLEIPTNPNDVFLLTGANKALRHDALLLIKDGAHMKWDSGNVALANGADVKLVGNATMTVEVIGNRAYFGQAQLLVQHAQTQADLDLYAIEPEISFDDYFDSTLDAEARKTTYMNPLCGLECTTTNEFRLQDEAMVVMAATSNSAFLVPMFFQNQTRMELKENCVAIIESGGELGDRVVVNMEQGSRCELTGGQLLMGLNTIIQGDGDLIVLEGAHNMAGSIDALITISGGSLVWPENRGDNQTVVLKGGLIIDKIGKLEVQPWSTVIEIKKTVTFKDNCIVQFPMIGVASQPGMSDRQVNREDRLDAPDTSPSGRMVVEDKMEFLGGTLRGKAKFEVGLSGELVLDGDDKHIRSLAKLINRGRAVWGSGNILTADQGDFLNLGTLEMKNYTTFAGENFFEGTVIPTENGGDRYALSFHSWDMDEGQLDFSQYIETRKRLVSKAPGPWTEVWQNGLEDVDGIKRDGSSGYVEINGNNYGNPQSNEITGTFAAPISEAEMYPFYEKSNNQWYSKNSPAS